MAFPVEMVVDRTAHNREHMKTSHPPKPLRRPFSPPQPAGGSSPHKLFSLGNPDSQPA
jgi:hypothetical protein